MKIVVIGGTGLIGSKLVRNLQQHGHDAVPASPNTGVNTLTGEGLADVLKGASVVVDVSNSPSFEETAATNFFSTATANLLRHEKAVGVQHHVALSVVGTEKIAKQRPSDAEQTIRGYFRAKLLQENLIKQSRMPFSIVHATQFFEFVKNIADASSDGKTVRVAPVLIQPMAADDVAAGVAEVALGAPVNAIIEIGGPEQFPLDQFILQGLRARNDARAVIADPAAGYFGIEVDERSLVPGANARLGKIRFETWLADSAKQAANPPAQPAATASAGTR